MKELSKSEEQVMISIWKSSEEPTLKTVLADVNKRFGHEWKHQTVSTFLRRLTEKGWLIWKKKGLCAYYTPAISKQEYRKQKLHGLLENLYDGDVESLKEDL